MALRCFVFSSDEGTADTIRQVMTGLGIEGESCSLATTAVDKVTRHLFQIVVIDWDQQPEAGMLLSAARERRPAERPLTIAIVGHDGGVPKALQAGANSILRRPLLLNQITDTLTTARDLLRSRQESTATAAAAATGGASSSKPASMATGAETSLRSGEFLQSTTPAAPGGQFETDSEVAHFREQSAAEDTDPLKDLEPVAAAVAEAPPAPSFPPPDEPRGLEWYLKARGVTRQPGSVLGTSSTPAESSKPELLGYDQTPSASTPAELPKPEHAIAPPRASTAEEKRQEAQLFSYIAGENADPAAQPQSHSRIGKRAIVAAVLLAACAIAAAPQAPWHARLIGLPARARRAAHNWLNPQPVTTVTQAPTTYEDFGRAGDEYKLPVAETIPDATTDPSQISVLPVVDPTVKKPPADTALPEGRPDSSSTAPADSSQTVPADPAATQPVQPSPDPAVPAATGTATPLPADPKPSTPEISSVAPSSIKPPQPMAHTQASQYSPPPEKVPSSLKSQLAPMAPLAGGNKPIEAALPSIEPVDVPELTERAFLIEQPKPVYPPNAAGKQGTVTLQVLIGRDGNVQDAKFLQGSLVFARAAIDSVRQWKFKPYVINGRPVSVQTTLTIHFAPAQ